MQIPALFTILSILGTTLAAPNPLLLGIPGVAQIDVPTNGLSKEALAALIIPPAVPSNAAVAQNAIASIIANLPLPSDGVKVSINPSILPTGVSLPVVPSSIPVPASAADALKALNGFIVGLKPTTTSATDAVAQLKKIQGDLEAANQQATADLKANGASYQQYVDSASATVKSLNSVLTSLPKTVQTDGSVKVAAAAVDAQLASLVSTLKAASASSTKFATDFAKAGINVKSTGSSLLSKTAAAIPAPSGLAGLLSGFGF